jgi:hypothetical protein
MRFPEIKFKDCEIERPKRLKKDLLELKKPILDFIPRNYNSKRLNTLRIRIFPFPKKENCNEYYFTKKNKKYMFLNSRLMSRNYYASLQYALHGITHSFCYLNHDISEEVFCEFVSYSILREFLKERGEKFTRKVIKSIMNRSPREYNVYFRTGRKLDEKNKNILLKMNSKAKNRKLSKKKEKMVFSRLLKMKKINEDDVFNKLPELEKGFKKV